MAHTDEHIVPIRTYITILAALLLLLALTTVCGFVDFDRFMPGHAGWSTGIALSIAIVKALLVMIFFMHLKHASRLTWVFAAGGFLWLGIMVALMMTDYATRNQPPGVNPKGEPRYLAAPADPDIQAPSN